MDISKKAFIVTGAASGLGEATARMIVRRGGRVVLADVNPAGKRDCRRTWGKRLLRLRPT